MSDSTPLADLVVAITSGLRHPHHAWSAVVIALAVVGGWLLAGMVRRSVDARVAALTAAAVAHGKAVDLLQFSIEGLRRLAFPIAALMFLWAGALVLRLTGVLSHPSDAQLLRLASILIGASAVIRFVMFVLRRVLRRGPLVGAFERGLGVLVWGVVALHVTGMLDDVIAWLEATQFPIGRATVSLWNVISAAVVVAVAVLGALWAGSAIETRLQAAAEIDSSLRVVLARVARTALMLLAILIGLQVAGIDLTILSVFGGALGVGLGLGLQRIASNYVSGFAILLDRSLRIGDLIAVDKFYGIVTRISTRYTVVDGLDGTEAVIPNEMLVSLPVTNLSLSNRRARVALKATVCYGSDLDRALRAMEDAAHAVPRVLADPPPGALVLGFGAHGVELEVGCWIVNPETNKGGVISDLARAVHAGFQREGVEIALPARDIRILRRSSAASPRQDAPPPPAPAPAA